MIINNKQYGYDDYTCTDDYDVIYRQWGIALYGLALYVELKTDKGGLFYTMQVACKMRLRCINIA